MTTRIAYMPLDTYPEPAPDAAIAAALDLAAEIGCQLHAAVFATRIPTMPSSPLGGLLLDLPGMVHAAEDKSRAEAARLEAMMRGRPDVNVVHNEAPLGEAAAIAAAQARYFDLAILPWSGETAQARDIATAMVFGSGRPTVMAPAGGARPSAGHIAVAWDESRVAARALGDALHLLAPGGRVTVLTVEDEKKLRDGGLAQTLVESLRLRGIDAGAPEVRLEGRSIAEALQQTAVEAGAGMLAMGGFGHSRLRDFVLGGATQGVLGHLRLPVLLSH